MGCVEVGQEGLGGGPGRRGLLPIGVGLRGADGRELTRWDGGSAAGGIFLQQKESPTVMPSKPEGIPTNIQQHFPPQGELAQKPWQCCHLLGDTGTEEQEEIPGTDRDVTEYIDALRIPL